MRRKVLSLIGVFLTSAGLLCGTTDWEALVCCRDESSMLPVFVPSGSVGTAVSTGKGAGPNYVAITPDGKRAIVANFDNGTISVLDLTTTPISVTTPITVPSGGAPCVPAITPDGTMALVTDNSLPSVYVLGLTGPSVTLVTTLTDSNFDGANGVAITPNGKMAVVSTGGGKINILDLTTSTIPITTTFPGFGALGSVAITPDGKRALVSEHDYGLVLVVDLKTLTLLPDVSGLTGPVDIAITPDGRLALVTNDLGEINALDLTTDPIAVTTPISVLGDPLGVAIAPDGKSALVTDNSNSFAYLLSITPSSVSLVGRVVTQDLPIGDAISPDQAPRAVFQYSKTGSRVTFDASESTSPVGSIATYKWDFGDGDTITTYSPIVTHTYDVKRGTFEVTLKVTNTAGTSTKETTTFTGRTMSNHGGPSAQTSDTVKLKLIEKPFFFHGKLHPSGNRLLLKTWWEKSPAHHISSYEIFSWHKKIASVPASHKLRKHIYLPRKKYSHYRSYRCRHFLENRYTIRAIDKKGNASELKHLEIDP